MEVSSQVSLTGPPRSKVAKRRAAKRRRNALLSHDNPSPENARQPVENPLDFLEKLKSDFQEAKANGDSVNARLIQEQIWLAQEVAAGVKSSLTKDDLQNILDKIAQPKTLDVKKVEALNILTTNPHGPTSLAVQIEQLQKQFRKLQKKLAQITKLKERLQCGQRLEETQISKINREKELEDEIDDVEDQLYKLKRM